MAIIRIRSRHGRHGIVSKNHNTAPLLPTARLPKLRQEDTALVRFFRFRIPQPPAPRDRRDRTYAEYTLGQRELVLFVFGYSLVVISGAMRQHRTMARNCAPENPGIPDRRFTSSGMRALDFRRAQCSDVYAAPSIGPGLSRLPSWTMATAASTPSCATVSSGTVQLPELPLQSPSLTRLRTTLW
jgi:hypothetical protein